MLIFCDYCINFLGVSCFMCLSYWPLLWYIFLLNIYGNRHVTLQICSLETRWQRNISWLTLNISLFTLFLYWLSTGFQSCSERVFIIRYFKCWKFIFARTSSCVCWFFPVVYIATEFALDLYFLRNQWQVFFLPWALTFIIVYFLLLIYSDSPRLWSLSNPSFFNCRFWRLAFPALDYLRSYKYLIVLYLIFRSIQGFWIRNVEVFLSQWLKMSELMCNASLCLIIMVFNCIWRNNV